MLQRTIARRFAAPGTRDADASRLPTAGRHYGDRFTDRVHALRTIGLGLGFFCVASVMRLHDEPLARWLLLVANAFVWPHAAAILSRRSADPHRAEVRNLHVDSALGGMWIAIMQFNLLPSVLLATMLTVDKISVGGFRLALQTSIWLALACLITSAVLGLPVQIDTPMSVIVACMPFAIAYPLALSHVTYELSNAVARKNRRLEVLGRTDELTGLANRQYALSVAAIELDRHRRSGRPAVLVIIDVDRFKSINDRYGHPAGDEVLRSVGAILRECSRAVDTTARYGGDEFLMVLPDADLHGAASSHERIRERLKTMTLEQVPGLQCTLSVGAAEVHREMVDVEDWIQQADAALYRAKEAGRNRFAVAPGVVGEHRLTQQAPARVA